ncbi:MAG TPA: hypothetical protein VOA41_22060 [Candidatus Dormibacteraeota bacterium]|nr:hypothetical protein [Candidatus Dormibacteraeota bacterium]
MRVYVLLLPALVAAGIAGSLLATGTAIARQQSAPAPQSAEPRQSQILQQSAPQADNNIVESLAGLVSKTPLNPSLRSGVQQVRFSPSGTYILVQDAVGVYLLTQQPLALLFWLPAREASPARFAADSSSLLIALRNGLVGRWNLPSGQPIGQKQLDVKEGCPGTLLSRDGELLACEGPRLDLHLYRVTSGEEIFSDSLKVPKLKLMRWYPISRPRGSAFAEPIGYSWARSPQPIFDQTKVSQHMDFSPNNKFFLLADPSRDAVAVDLTSNTKVSIGGSLRRGLDAAMHFITSETIAASGPENKLSPTLLSFPSGREVEKLPITGTPAGTASDTRYLVFREPDMEGVHAFDLESRRTVKVPPQAAMDFSGDETVGVSADGVVSILYPGEREPRRSLALPRAPLAPLRVATVSPDLRTLIISAAGQAAAWDLTTGNRLSSYPDLVGAWCEDALSCYLQFPRHGNLPARTEKMNRSFVGTPPSSAPNNSNRFARQLINWPIPVGADPADAAAAGKANSNDEQPTEQNISSGPVVLRIFRQPSQTVSFNSILQVLDVKTGSILWSRVLESGVPIPFANPQGDRVVLAWRAESPGARAAASRTPFARERLQQARLQAQDSFFEVVDARTGKALSGVVVQNAAGPDRFDSAFAGGDWLITTRDANRLVIYSLTSGEEKGRAFGYYPAISPESALLGLTDGAATVTLYDLAKFQKRSMYRFPSAVVYAHFAADGKRLFVLTVDQVAYVLDVSAGI